MLTPYVLSAKSNLGWSYCWRFLVFSLSPPSVIANHNLSGHGDDKSYKSSNHKMTFAGRIRSCPGFGLFCALQGRSLQIKKAHSEKENSTYSKTYEAKVFFERDVKIRYLSQ